MPAEVDRPTVRDDAAASGAPVVRVLVVDDEESMRYFVERGLRRSGFAVQTAADGASASRLLEQAQFDVHVVDVRMPGKDGVTLLAEIRARDPDAIVVLMTAYGTIGSAVEAVRRGAADYLAKPFEIEQLVLAIERARAQRATVRENRDLRRLIGERATFGGLVGRSPAMQAVYQKIELLRDSAATVLITGESGTGKELVARTIHMHSNRAQGPFSALHCAALSHNLLENELFGHEAGAFTGATGRKVGLLARADGGTLFLDEVAEISVSAQLHLVPFLQDHAFLPLGATRPTSVDVRVIAGTNRDLERLVAEGVFRADLFFRLNVVPIRLPPLRERREDIPTLLAHYLEHFARSAGQEPQAFSVEAMAALGSYAWPGNVRELQNIVERMVVMHRHKTTIELDDLPDEVRQPDDRMADRVETGAPQPFETAMTAFERRYFLAVLRAAAGNVSEAARLAGVSRTNLHRKLKRLGIEHGREPGD